MMNGLAGGMWFGWLVGLALVGVLIWMAVRASSNSSESSPHGSPNEDAMEILRRRLARGEIDEREFDEKRKRLSL